MTYRIKNWSKFQHFKDRRPPWIKLYRDLLDDLEWFELDPVSSKNLINFWLIASEFNGELPSIEILAFRLRLKKQEVTAILSKLSHWMEQDDNSTISTRYQSDSTERETETEIERETETTILVESKIPPCPHSAIINIYHEVLPELPRVVSWNKTREGYLKQRWRQMFIEFECKDTEDGLDWFRNDFFVFVKGSKFLTGKVVNKDRKPFLADLEWMIKPTNFTKIIERKYEN
jgi:hypothetical protein